MCTNIYVIFGSEAPSHGGASPRSPPGGAGLGQCLAGMEEGESPME